MDEYDSYDDYWGDISGVWTKSLLTIDNAKEAVEFAIKTLKKKYKGIIIKGAGCPPDKWIEEFDKNECTN